MNQKRVIIYIQRDGWGWNWYRWVAVVGNPFGEFKFIPSKHKFAGMMTRAARPMCLLDPIRSAVRALLERGIETDRAIVFDVARQSVSDLRISTDWFMPLRWREQTTAEIEYAKLDIPQVVKIYALVDETGTPHYVGKATCLSSRKSSHLRGITAPSVASWVHEVSERGGNVRQVVLSTSYSVSENKAEVRFISLLRRRFLLLNRHPVRHRGNGQNWNKCVPDEARWQRKVA